MPVAVVGVAVAVTADLKNATPGRAKYNDDVERDRRREKL